MPRVRRPGFTLIELLVVVAILGALAAITAAGVSKVRASQKAKTTDWTVSKLQLALDQQWKAVIDRCMMDARGNGGTIPTTLKTQAGNDDELALAAWTYINLRREFPQTFAEARANVDIPNPGGAANTGERKSFLTKRATFNSITTSGGNAQNEGAALLYLILSEKGSGGMNYGADDATNNAQGTVTIGSNTFTVFVDAYGTPITFVRLAKNGFNGELNDKPYANTDIPITANKSSRDPLDPKGKLLGASATFRNKLKTGGTSGVFATGDTANTAQDFDGTNRQPAVVSAGANKDFSTNNIFGDDNSVGYRLRREGGRGD